MATANSISRQVGDSAGRGASRAYYIDRIRVILTALVVLHHTAITYGAPGGWYYRELPTTASLTGILFTLFVSTNQAYFMGFFFLIAGYFTPASYDRKGPGKFLVDRLIRLGIPLALYGVLLDPLTNSLSPGPGESRRRQAQPFLPDLASSDSHRRLEQRPALVRASVAYFLARVHGLAHMARRTTLDGPTLRSRLFPAGCSPRSASVPERC